MESQVTCPVLESGNRGVCDSLATHVRVACPSMSREPPSQHFPTPSRCVSSSGLCPYATPGTIRAVAVERLQLCSTVLSLAGHDVVVTPRSVLYPDRVPRLSPRPQGGEDAG